MLPTLSFDFISYDDPWLIVKNSLLHSLSVDSLRKIWFDFDFPTRYRLGAEYLPVRDMFVALDWRLFGSRALGHRLTHCAAYGLVCGSFAGAVFAWTERRSLGWIAGLLFALHPAHIEAGAWLSERKGLLSATFLFSSWWLMKRFCDRLAVRSLITACLLLAAAVLSKSVAIVGVVIAPAWFFWFGGAQGARPRKGWVGFALYALVGALAFVPVYIAGRSMEMVQPYHGGGFLGTLMLFFRVHAKYLMLMFLRGPFTVGHVVSDDAHVDTLAAAGLLSVLLIGLAMIWGIAKQRPYLGLCATWWFCALAPVSHLLFPLQNRMADRYLLLPSGAWAIAMGAIVLALPKLPKYALLAGLMSVSLAESMLQLQTWRSSERVFAHAVDHYPGFAKGWNQLALIEEKRKDFDKAWALTEQGLHHSPGDWHLLHRQALILNKTNQSKRAMEAFRRAAQHPEADKAQANYALLLLRAGRSNEALRYARRAVRTRRGADHNQRTLGVVAYQLGHTEEACEAFSVAAELRPDEPQNQYNLGLCNKSLHNLSSAK